MGAKLSTSTANWSWHPHQPAPVAKKTIPQSMFYKDAPFTKLQEKMCGLSALPWRPNSTVAGRSWRRQRHSSPKRPWSCSLRTPRRRRRLLGHTLCISITMSSVQRWHDILMYLKLSTQEPSNTHPMFKFSQPPLNLSPATRTQTFPRGWITFNTTTKTAKIKNV